MSDHPPSPVTRPPIRVPGRRRPPLLRTTLTLAALIAGSVACGDGGATGPDPAEDPPLPEPDWTPDAAVLVERLDFAAFKEKIRILSDFGDRTQGSASNVEAGGWIEERLEAYGYEVERHEYTFEGEPRSNLYATKVGSTSPDTMLIVSAHMDGRGGGGAADDDGSGVSLVMEAARVLALADVETRTSVRFIFWNNEETGLNGSRAYVEDRAGQQGEESPSGSGSFPEPVWAGMIQHDMILFDHGLPPGDVQSPSADIDVEYQIASVEAGRSRDLASLLVAGSREFSTDYPAERGDDMRNTDSWPFRNLTAAVSVRENRRVEEIGAGSNPHWHQTTDVFDTYSDDDFRLGFNALQMTLGLVAHASGATVVP